MARQMELHFDAVAPEEQFANSRHRGFRDRVFIGLFGCRFTSRFAPGRARRFPAFTKYRGKSGKRIRKIFKNFAEANGRELADWCSHRAPLHREGETRSLSVCFGATPHPNPLPFRRGEGSAGRT